MLRNRAYYDGPITVDDARFEACPHLTAAFALLGKRWNALILDLLAVRAARFSDLDQAIPGISDRMLGERLRELVDAGVIEHTRSPGGPAMYRLTDAGRSLQPALEAIRNWSIGVHSAGKSKRRGSAGPVAAPSLGA